MERGKPGQSREGFRRGNTRPLAKVSFVTAAKAGVHGGVEQVRDTQGYAGGNMDARFRGHDGCGLGRSFFDPEALPYSP